MIHEILFYLTCCESLKDTYKNANDGNKERVETFLKTWLFYNSGPKDIFWRGTVSHGLGNQNFKDSVKEHWYPNKSVTKHIMSDGFLQKSKIEQISEIFQYMQFNLTTKAENNRLKKYQVYQIFYDREGVNGDPAIAYERANVNLKQLDPCADKLDAFKSFLTPNKTKVYYLQINAAKAVINKFTTIADTIEVEILHLGNRCVLFKGELRKIQKIIFEGFINSITENELEEFYNQIDNRTDNKPIRRENNFTTEQRRVVSITPQQANFPIIETLYYTTYRGIDYLFPWFKKMIEFRDGDVFLFTYKNDVFNGYEPALRRRIN
jgi:hypothetical protein